MILHNKYKQFRTVALIAAIGLLTACGGGKTQTTTTAASTSSELISVSISWLAPTTRTDNSVLTDLAGFNIYVDDGNGYIKKHTINSPGVSTHLVEDLPAGSYNFAVTAFDANGVESAFSSIASI